VPPKDGGAAEQGAKAPAADTADNPATPDDPPDKTAEVRPAPGGEKTASSAATDRPAERPARPLRADWHQPGEPAPAAAIKASAEALPNFGFSASAPAAAAAAGAPATAATAMPAVPVAGLAVEIAAHARAGINRLEIRLDPPELGRIDVRLDVTRDGRVTSHVAVDRPETLNLLQREQPQLERALEQAGLRTADNGLQFSLRDQSFTGRDGTGRQPAARLVIPDNELSSVAAAYSRLPRLGGVDIRV
jgi:chemotaxis protein MotD